MSANAESIQPCYTFMASLGASALNTALEGDPGPLCEGVLLAINDAINPKTRKSLLLARGRSIGRRIPNRYPVLCASPA
jgi:hypothetical protein